MSESLTQEIKRRIQTLKQGSVIIAKDFTDIGGYETVRKVLRRLSEDGCIRFLYRGIYDIPEYSEVLQECSSPDPNLLAKGIARNFSWNILPTANTALNVLGLSTQVPAAWEYISSGPSRDYAICGVKLSFFHRNLRESSNMSEITATVIQALKYIGKDNVSSETICAISGKLNDSDRQTVLEESRMTSSWIYEQIKAICGVTANV